MRLSMFSRRKRLLGPPMDAAEVIGNWVSVKDIFPDAEVGATTASPWPGWLTFG